MKRYAAHYIFLSGPEIFKMHWIELDEECKISRIAPLSEEIENTGFYNGILFPVPLQLAVTPDQIWKDLCTLRMKLPDHTIFGLLEMLQITTSSTDIPVAIFHLDRISILPPESSTDDCRSNSHIQRL